MERLRQRKGLNTLLVSLLILAGAALWGYLTLRDTVSTGLPMGAMAPELNLPDLDGRVWNWDDFAGTPVVLRFSSRMCAYCHDDFDHLEALQAAYRDRLQVVAVELSAPPDLVASAVGRRLEDVPVLIDPTGAVGVRYRLDALPILYFVDANGRLVSRAYGELSEVNLEPHLAAILRPPTGYYPELEAEFEAIARQLQCLECRGRSVWESMSPSAWDLREEIYLQLQMGKTRQEILEYFEAEYGPWVLMSPPRKGTNYLAYVMPFLFLGVGGLTVQWFLLRRRQERTDAENKAPSTTVDQATEDAVNRRLKELM